MKAFNKRKGIALPEYVLIALFFGLVLGIGILQISPGLLKGYLKNSTQGAKIEGETFHLGVLGE